MSKKKVNVMMEEKQYFIYGKTDEKGNTEIPGCIANGVSREAAEAIFEDMETFAAYAFNKSHAAAYAVISYQTAYLKCHYPAEFMAALMSSMAGKAEFISSYVRNAKDMGIIIDPPSVLKSGRKFTAENGHIRFGLLGVKNVGEGPVEAIIAAREHLPGDPDFYDFINAINPKDLNKRTIESLILAGAFDDICPNRAQLMAACEEAVKRAQKKAKAGNNAQVSLFQLEGFEDEQPANPPLPAVDDFSKEEKLSGEKEMLGVYISGHPLDDYAALMRGLTDAVTTDVNEKFASDDNEEGQARANTRFHDGDVVVLAGMITAVKYIFTKKQQEMSRFVLEDYVGSVACIAFPGLFEKKRSYIHEDSIVAVKGRVSEKDAGSAELLLEDVIDINSPELMDAARPRRKGPVPAAPEMLKLRVTEAVSKRYGGTAAVMSEVEKVMSANPGETHVRIYLPDGKCRVSGRGHGVCISEDLRVRLSRLLGERNIKLIR